MKSRLLALGVVVLVYVIFALTFYNKTVSRYSSIINDYTSLIGSKSDLKEFEASIQTQIANGDPNKLLPGIYAKQAAVLQDVDMRIENMKDETYLFYQDMGVVTYLCYVQMLFFI